MADARARVVLHTDDATRLRMSRQRSKDTSPERALRSLLHRRGLRFRLHQRPVAGVRRQADIVFRRARVAVFVDGCFWHCCPEHATWPRANGEWWRDKLAANVRRDRDTDQRLRDAGWTVVRVWEHEDPAAAAERVDEAVRLRQTG